MTVYWVSHYAPTPLGDGFRIYVRCYTQTGVSLRLAELRRAGADLDTVRIEEGEDPPWKA